MDDNDQEKNIIINNRIAECTASLASLVGETIKSLYSDIEDKIKKQYSKQFEDLSLQNNTLKQEIQQLKLKYTKTEVFQQKINDIHEKEHSFLTKLKPILQDSERRRSLYSTSIQLAIKKLQNPDEKAEILPILQKLYDSIKEVCNYGELLKEFDTIIENGNISIPPLLQQQQQSQPSNSSLFSSSTGTSIPLQLLEHNAILEKPLTDTIEREEIEKLKKENVLLQKRYDELLEKIMGKNPDLSFIAAHVLSQNPSLVLRGPVDSNNPANNSNNNSSSTSSSSPLNPLSSNPPSSSSQPRSLHQSPQDTIRTIDQLERTSMSYPSPPTNDMNTAIQYSPPIDQRTIGYVQTQPPPPQQQQQQHYSPPTQLTSYTPPSDSRRLYENQNTVYSPPHDGNNNNNNNKSGGGSGGGGGGAYGVSAPSSYRTLPIHSYHNDRNTTTTTNIPAYMNNIQANSIPSVLRPTNCALPYNPAVGSSRSKNQPMTITSQQQEYNVQLTPDQSSIYEQLIAQFPSFSPNYILHLFVYMNKSFPQTADYLTNLVRNNYDILMAAPQSVNYNNTEELIPVSHSPQLTEQYQSSPPTATATLIQQQQPPQQQPQSLLQPSTSSSSPTTTNEQMIQQSQQQQQPNQTKPKVRTKAQLCQAYLHGRCNKSKAQCTYAHGEDDLRIEDGDIPYVLHPNYKTELCQYYMKGTCLFPAYKCRFAHGLDDLRKKGAPLTPVWKETPDKDSSTSNSTSSTSEVQNQNKIDQNQQKSE